MIQFEAGNLRDYFLIWLGVSIAAHAIPSAGDSNAIWDAIKQPNMGTITRCIAVPITLLIDLATLGKFIWLDVIYGVGVAMLLPNIGVWLLA